MIETEMTSARAATIEDALCRELRVAEGEIEALLGELVEGHDVTAELINARKRVDALRDAFCVTSGWCDEDDLPFEHNVKDDDKIPFEVTPHDN